MKNYTFAREATTEEINDYELFEALTAELDDEEFSEICDYVSDYCVAYGDARKANYGKVYRLAKRLGITTKVIENWYFTEVC